MQKKVMPGMKTVKQMNEKRVFKHYMHREVVKLSRGYAAWECVIQYLYRPTTEVLL
jgi:hypothetical protein